MRKFVSFLKDWLSFGKEVGYVFALRYKLGIAQEGIEFFTIGDEEFTI